MSTTVQRPTSSGISVPQVGAGIAGGLAGGLVFGLMMQMMSMLPMVAQLVGSTSVAIGWGTHLAISAIIGAGFGLLGARFLGSLLQAATAGAVYGAVWWVLGPLVLMPARLGMPMFMVDAMAWKSLMGHVVFGLLMGAVSAVVLRRGAAR
jgi:uncharacterized membrane protein YagU involved in acid resistance